jgi:DNA-binding transcriptional regulator YiaG
MPPDLRSTRTTAGLTQSQAAALLGCSLRTLQGWEAGRGGTALALATRLLRILTGQERVPRTLRAPPAARPNAPPAGHDR